MQVVNKSSYITTIYSATIVNNNRDQDPDNKGRVQLYIPSINYNYADVYKTYMNSSDKKSDEKLFKAFPWATTLVNDLKNGDEVYGSYIDGDSTQFIVLGINTSSPMSTQGVGGLEDMSSLVSLALDVVLHNEIGVDIGAWSNNTIPDSRFSTITLHDGGVYDKVLRIWIKQGCWAIGLIQWNGVRAYDTCYAIAEADGNWKSYFTKDCDLKSSINASLASKNTAGQRNNFSIDKGWNPEKDGATYNAIKALISSETGKKVQKQLAYDATYDVINMLVEKGCKNPAILIYMADFYNQYGSGYSQTTQKCVEACNQSGNMIEQLDWLISNQLKPNFSSFSTYGSRRQTTYDYIVELYNAGKLNSLPLTDEGNTEYLGSGQYCVPFKGSFSITALWGPNGYLNHYNSTGTHYHTGIDFGCPTGTTLIACTEGELSVISESSSSGYGYGLKIMANDGNMIIYGHLSSFARRSGSVKKGDIIGYSGNTGNSTGAHLHFEIRQSPYKGGYNGIGNDINPLPLIGAGDKGRNEYVSG